MNDLTIADPPVHAGERIARIASSPVFWVMVIGAVFTWSIAWTVRTRLPPPLPVLAELPRFELTDQEGRTFGTRELEGRAWVASFVFTRCATVCPAVTAKMARIQGRTRQLAPAFHLVSFSVDPEFDTPERLAAYARAHRASPRLWSFLTGAEPVVKAAVVDGMKIAMERQGGPDGRFEGVLHGSALVLVDQRGRVRGYYDSNDDVAVDRLVRDAGLLVNRGG
jgi:protein SCO1/2